MTTYEALVSIAERREVDIMLLDFPEQVRDKAAGVYADYPEYPFIVINKGLSPETQTKALAHELAHHQLHHDLQSYLRLPSRGDIVDNTS